MNSQAFSLSFLLLFRVLDVSEESFFVKMAFLQLDGDIIQAIAVPNILQCCWKCDRLPECLSLNVADVPTRDGLYECQMLTTETNKYSGLLKPSQHYHYYTRFTDKCATMKCVNGGTCETTGYNDFRCHCPQGFTGITCNMTHSEIQQSKTYKWLKINTSPVSFGAKGNSFGRFYIKENGSVTTVKLVHLSGYVACNSDPDARSNWGCAPYRNKRDRLMTILTNDKNQRILPQDEFITDPYDLAYALPGVTSKSPELVFTNLTTPMDVNAGQEYRIWFGEDLMDNTDSNNEGTLCADVYMYGLY